MSTSPSPCQTRVTPNVGVPSPANAFVVPQPVAPASVSRCLRVALKGMPSPDSPMQQKHLGNQQVIVIDVDAELAIREHPKMSPEEVQIHLVALAKPTLPETVVVDGRDYFSEVVDDLFMLKRIERAFGERVHEEEPKPSFLSKVKQLFFK